MPDARQLRLWIFGFQISQAIHVAARLGIAEHIDQHPVSLEHLAQACGCPADGLQRLLRALCGIGLFAEQDDGFVHAGASELLRRDHPQSQYLAASLYGAEHYASWGDLYQAVRLGDPVFEQRHGQPYYQYLERRASQPGIHADYLAADAAAQERAIQAVCDLGDGARVARVEHTEQAPPPAADLYLLTHQLHRLDDDQARALLRRCAEAMAPDSRLLLVELMFTPGNGFDAARWLDLNNLLIGPGRERDQAHYLALARDSGLALGESHRLANGMTLLDLRLTR
ncbi:O-methyltransferase [Pseudomonas entomophila]|uniref:Methyltransferase n=2 Tax=Pseudomonas entomophila TaxID=312306 RepID=A0ABY9QMA9_9PSED|nr:O-methyltransferase [Pseudomonas entomophila]WMW04246.1 methyltransferase [Pseudomonas entomophila]CAK14968.1 putative O-methyltransferase [Pseudomonas entomophila L48]